MGWEEENCEKQKMHMAAGIGHTMITTDNGELWVWGHISGGTEHCIWCGSRTIYYNPYPIRKMDEVVYVSSGSHTMVIRLDGSLWAWGSNWAGQLGDGTIENRYQPVKILDDVVSVSTGGSHTMAIRADNSLWGWGIGVNGNIGDGKLINRYYPVKVMDNVIAVSAGSTFTLAIRNDGSLWGWGCNYDGQLASTIRTIKYIPIEIMTGVTDISVHGNHAMAIMYDGSLWAWGNNFGGQLGDGTNITRHEPVKIMDDVKAVSTGGLHTLAIRNDGSLWAWGNNIWGQIGDGSDDYLQEKASSLWEALGDAHVYFNPFRNTPVRILENVVNISAGEHHSLAITEDGTLFAWGDNHAGQLGDGSRVNSSKPIIINKMFNDLR